MDWIYININYFILAVSSPSQKAVLSSSFNQDQGQNEEEEMEFGTFCEMTLSGNSKHIKFFLFIILLSLFCLN